VAVSDDLIRRFKDKIQARPAPHRRSAPPAPLEAADEANPPAAGIQILDLQVGPHAGASHLNPGFREGVPRLRLTLDLGADLRRRHLRLEAPARTSLLALCPHLTDHECGGGPSIQDMLSGDGPAPEDGAPAGTAEGDRTHEGDGLALAHLIEHVAIDLMVTISGAPRCSGATGAYRDRLDRFDIFLECPVPALGRAVALLATAAVRDLCAGADRTDIHRRCRDLLSLLLASGRQKVVPEDVASDLRWPLPEAVEALEAVGRLGFLESIPAPFTFSSTTGRLFRRAPEARL
jgi:hypothetical protein